MFAVQFIGYICITLRILVQCVVMYVLHIYFIRRDFGRFAFAPNAEFAAGTMKENLRSVTKNREVQDLLRIFLLEEGACPIPPDCDIYDPYRTADGSCNNLDKPLLGRAFTAQKRLIDNAYDDSM